MPNFLNLYGNWCNWNSLTAINMAFDVIELLDT